MWAVVFGPRWRITADPETLWGGRVTEVEYRNFYATPLSFIHNGGNVFGDEPTDGMSSTPVLDGGVLYLQLIHGEGDAKTREACVVAIDGATGKQVWRADRPSDAIAENEHSYASAMLYQDGDKKFLLTHGADFLIAHDLKDGHELWRCGGLNRRDDPVLGYDRTLRFVASPVAVPGLIIAPSAKQHPVLCIKPDGKGDITN